jgi:hypothetical protein
MTIAKETAVERLFAETTQRPARLFSKRAIYQERESDGHRESIPEIYSLRECERDPAEGIMNELKGDSGPTDGIMSAENVTRFPEANASAVSWGAILAGGLGAAALSLILLLLGTGLGLSSVSPWANRGMTAATLGVSTILWLTLTQLVASGMGGYLAGRLRTRWSGVHTDEVYFRDTAHGFLAWAVASLATAALLTSTVGSIIHGGAQTVASGAGGAATLATATAAGAAAQMQPGRERAENNSGPTGYFLDSLFRKNAAGSPNAGAPGAASAPAPDAVSNGGPPPIAEVSRIFMNSIRSGPLSPDDTRYVGQLVAQTTGLSQEDAEKRVSETYARLQANLMQAEAAAKGAADKARKASAYVSLWMFISLLIGAFCASLAATYGGRRRDL